EMPARRPAADAVGARFKAQSYLPNTDVYDDLDVLVETSDGEVLTLLAADRETDDGRVFTHVYDHERHIWWERSLSWMLATAFLREFTKAVKASTHLAEQLYLGQHVNAAARPRYFEWRSPGQDAKFWELYWDETNGVLATRYGRLGSAGKVNTKRMDPVKGAKKAASLVAAKTGAGYREIP
ncbi:MAG TPA: WGR domain-containing protein, partial [Phytomonospora sp.]